MNQNTKLTRIREHPREATGQSPDELITTVSDILEEMLANLRISHCSVDFNQELLEAPLVEARNRGYALSGVHSLRHALSMGVYLTSTMYGHVTDNAQRTYIIFYIMFMFYVDDTYFGKSDRENGLLFFISRFNQNQPQEEPSLTAFATFLREDTATVFEPIGGGIIIASSLNFINGMILESSVSVAQISPFAQGFPYFVRNKSGFAEACIILAFPRDMPVIHYAQAFPEMLYFVLDLTLRPSDIMSFYKEELVGESENLVSLLAAVTDSKIEFFQNFKICGSGSPCIPVTRHEKYEVLRHLSRAVSLGHQRTLQILAGAPLAREVYLKLAKGYVCMYISMRERYKLDELNL
ncbi:hypothetical protein D9757_011075 [Collybiopsis confluens]|uniref:Terpenoid synthase n=1 Tax=Collybiopsis confluens TaxID=2823264 RepID=A0A8H5GQJ4_9AGAR|nr:hypothetical protein D9757_011075 [Collybiopsis confluens]